MEQKELAATLESGDPAVALRAVGALHRLAEQIEAWRPPRTGARLVVGADRRRPRRLPPVDPRQVRKARAVMPKRLSVDARKLVLTSATEEARRRGDRRLGTTHFLLALLSLQRPDPAAELLDALGVDQAVVRKRLGGTAEGEAR